MVRRFGVDARGQVTALPDAALRGVAATDDLSVTVVGSRPVVLDRTTRSVHLPGGRVVPLDGAADAQLQDPGEDSGDVVMATAGALVHQPLDGSAATATPASYADVTVTITSRPDAPSRRMTSGGGTPKVNETSSGRTSATTSSLRSSTGTKKLPDPQAGSRNRESMRRVSSSTRFNMSSTSHAGVNTSP